MSNAEKYKKAFVEGLSINLKNLKDNLKYNDNYVTRFVNSMYGQCCGEIGIEYDFDLISGSVNQVSYQPGEIDAFYHRYDYDEDHRITDVYTSSDSVIWSHDAEYFYYLHGPVARMELGDDKVQGVDYAYTIQGWIKGVNSVSLDPNNDMGSDGDNNPVAKDVFGYMLNYFNGDYYPIGGNVSWHAKLNPNTSSFLSGPDDLFNGNIRSMSTSIESFMADGPMGYMYKYDQLNRIKSWIHINSNIRSLIPNC